MGGHRFPDGWDLTGGVDHVRLEEKDEDFLPGLHGLRSEHSSDEREVAENRSLVLDGGLLILAKPEMTMAPPLQRVTLIPPSVLLVRKTGWGIRFSVRTTGVVPFG